MPGEVQGVTLGGVAAIAISGQVALKNGGTSSDLSATGGANQFLKQTTAGGAITVAQITSGDLLTTLTPQFAHIGIGVTPDPTIELVISRNTSSSYTAQNSSLLQLIGPDAGQSVLTIDSFGNFPAISLRRADGTNASKTTVSNGDTLGLITANAYGNPYGNVSNGGSQIVFNATENWSNNSHGSRIIFATIANGTTSVVNRLFIDQSGSVAIGSGSQFQVNGSGLPIKSNNVTLTAQGLSLIVASGSAIAQTGAVASVAAFVTPNAASSFEIGGYIDVTAFTAGTVSMTCTYTDDGGTARTLTLPLIALTGTISTTIGSATVTHAVVSSIQTSGANSITIATTVAGWTGTYNVYAWIKQIK